MINESMRWKSWVNHKLSKIMLFSKWKVNCFANRKLTSRLVLQTKWQSLNLAFLIHSLYIHISIGNRVVISTSLQILSRMVNFSPYGYASVVSLNWSFRSILLRSPWCSIIYIVKVLSIAMWKWRIFSWTNAEMLKSSTLAYRNGYHWDSGLRPSVEHCSVNRLNNDKNHSLTELFSSRYRPGSLECSSLWSSCGLVESGHSHVRLSVRRVSRLCHERSRLHGNESLESYLSSAIDYSGE